MTAAIRVLLLVLGLAAGGADVTRAQDSRPEPAAPDVQALRRTLAAAAGDLGAVLKEVSAEGGSATVKLVVCDGTTTPAVTVRSRDLDLDLSNGVEYSARCGRSGEFEGELYFAGFGVSEPERDDYKSFAAEGKVLLLLPGRPPEFAGTSSRRLAAAASIAGKLRRAALKGARGVIFAYGKMDGGMPTDDPAWTELARSWQSGDGIAWERTLQRGLALEGWIPWDIARVLCSGARENLGNLAARARDLSFAPVPLEVTVQIRAEEPGTKQRPSEAVVGKSRLGASAAGRSVLVQAEMRTTQAERAGGSGIGPAGDAAAAAILALGRANGGLSWCFAPDDALASAGAALDQDAEVLVIVRSARVEAPLVVGQELSSLGEIVAAARLATGFRAALVRDDRAAGGDDRGAHGASSAGPPRPYLEVVLPVDADTETVTAAARFLQSFLQGAAAAAKAPRWLDAAESRPAESQPAK